MVPAEEGIILCFLCYVNVFFLCDLFFSILVDACIVLCLFSYVNYREKENQLTIILEQVIMSWFLSNDELCYQRFTSPVSSPFLIVLHRILHPVLHVADSLALVDGDS